MKECAKIHPLLPLYSEGELSTRDQNRVAAHLKQCPDARQDLKAFETMGRTLKTLPEPPFPSDLHRKIMSRVHGGRVSAPKRPVLYTLLPLAAAAGLACFFLFQYPVGLKQWHSPSPSQNDLTEEKESPSAKDLDLKSSAPQPAPMRLAKTRSNAPAPVPPSSKTEDASANFALSSNQPRAFAPMAKKAKVMRNVAPEKSSEDQFAEAAAPSANLYNSQATASSHAASSNYAAQPQNMTLSNVAAYSAQPTPSSIEASTDTFTGAFTSTPTDELEELVTDTDSFQKIWQNCPTNKPQPTVDFTKQAVIVLLAGSKPTTGYSIAVSRLEETDTQLIVHYKVGIPPAGGPVGEIVTRPWFLQIIPKPSKPIIFAQDE